MPHAAITTERLVVLLMMALTMVVAEESALASCLARVDTYRCFGDGSWLQFDRDGHFTLRPLAMLTGQTIDGTWRHDTGTTYVIIGTWAWANGESSSDDVRRMTMEINPSLEVVTIDLNTMPFDDPWYHCEFSCGIPVPIATATSATSLTPR